MARGKPLTFSFNARVEESAYQADVARCNALRPLHGAGRGVVRTARPRNAEPQVTCTILAGRFGPIVALQGGMPIAL